MGKSQLIKYGMREDKELQSSNTSFFVCLFFNLNDIFNWHVKLYKLMGTQCLSVSLSGSAHSECGLAS